jgi:large subunit ribosomal protein L22
LAKLRVVTKDVGISSRKVRLVVDIVRGKEVNEALTILGFLPTPSAKAVAKTIKSAVANAENNLQISPNNLKISSISADSGHTLKRYRPKSRGRISPILKRSSHITVILEEG